MIKKIFGKTSAGFHGTAGILLCFVFGFLTAFGKIFGVPSGFSAALVFALPPVQGLAAGAGGIIAGVLLYRFGAFPLCVAIVTACLLKLKPCFNPCLITSGVYTLALVASEVLSGGGAREIIRAVLLGALLFAVCWSSQKTGRQLLEDGEVPLKAGAVCLFAIVCALSGCVVGGVSIGMVAAAYAVLFAASRFGAGAACAVAAICAAGCGTFEHSGFAAAALLGIPGVICGLTSAESSNPVRTAAVFLGTVAPAVIIFGEDWSSLPLLWETAGACILFVLSYSSLSGKAFGLFRMDKKRMGDAQTSPGAERMKSALSDISERLYDLSSKGLPPKRNLGDEISAAVCVGCERTEACRGSLKKINDARDLADLYRALPECQRVPQISRAGTEIMRRGEYMQLNSIEQRNISRCCSDMLLSACEAMSDLQRELKLESERDEILSARLEKSLKNSGLKAFGVIVYRGGETEASFALSVKINEVKVMSIASEITGLDYLRCERAVIGEIQQYKLCPATKFTVEMGLAQLSAKKEASGDVAESFYRGNWFYALVSDGMGRGQSARAVALTLTGILKELLMAGFSVVTAINLSSVILKATLPEESFATLDLVRINLMTGAAESYKAGACQSYVFVDGGMTKLRGGGYPAGIICPCEVNLQRFYINTEADILLITDGAQDINEQKVISVISSDKEMSAGDGAAMLLGDCGGQDEQKNDDITVMMVKVGKRLL